MVNEWIFNLFGTSSDEIIARAKQDAKQESNDYYLPKINELSETNALLSSQNDYLKSLLIQNNISYE